MSAMQQIYATHCTFGTSAIERREGEMAERVLGYSARSSSFSPADLRKHFRTFERYLSYTLWSDSPAELRTTLVAATAPKRLVFMPSVSGFQMLGQVAYRTWDTTGKRAGSYFAHLVVAERAKDEAPWSILDCLRLWGAPGWQVEDSPTFSFDLPPLGDLRGLWTPPPERAFEDPFQPVISDDCLLRFLTQDDLSSGSEATFLPARWLAMPAKRRLELFRQALRGYLHIAGQGRDNAVLVAEPEVAALFFYGIARLLPEGELRHAISFSTFEGNLDRPATQLIATHFHEPFKTDLRPDRYQRGFALNTFLDGKATELRTPHPYADMILGRLTADGWRSVDEVFAAFEAGLGKTVADLGELVRAGELAERFLDPAATLDVASLERNDFTRRYVGKSLSTTLAGPAPVSLLFPLLETPDQRAILLLKWLAGGPHAAACERSLRYLREHLPESQLPRFLELSEIPVETKTSTLVRFVDQERRLPTGCEDLFDIAQGASRSARDQQLAPLAGPLLRGLRSDTVRMLADAIAPASQAAFFVELAAAVGRADEKQKWLRRMAVTGGVMSDESLSVAIERLGERLDLLTPEIQKEIGLRFVQLLNGIQRVPAEFASKLTQLRRAARLIESLADFQRDPSELGPSWVPIDRLNAWARVPEVIKQARLSSQEKRTGWAALRGEGPNDLQFRIGKQLAEALSRALPHNELRSEITAEDKALMMHNIIVALGGSDLLAPDWKTRAAYYLEYNHWYDTAAPVRRKSEAARRPWMFFGIGAGVATLLGTLVLLFMFSGDSRPATAPNGSGQTAQSTAKPGTKAKNGAVGSSAAASIKQATNQKTAASSSRTGTTSSQEQPVDPKPNSANGPAASTAPSLSANPAASANPANPDRPAKDNAVTTEPGAAGPGVSGPGVSGPAATVATAPKPATTQLDASLDDGLKPAGPNAPANVSANPPGMLKPAVADVATAKPAAGVTPKDGASSVSPTTPAPSAPPAPPAFSEPVERDFEVAELPLPAPATIEELLSDDPRPLGESSSGQPIEWILWQDARHKGYEHRLRIHGLQMAKSPWTKVSVTPITTPDKYVMRATHDDGMETDLMEFRMPISTGVLTMRVPGLNSSLKELNEIQRQLFFCVLEIQSDAGSRYLALHPPRAAKPVSMDTKKESEKENAKVPIGLVQGKPGQPGLAPRPAEQRLEKLYIAGGALAMKDKSVYLFGAEKGDWSGSDAEDWALRPRSGSETPAVAATECRIRFKQTTGSEAKLTIWMPTLPKEDELSREIDTLNKTKKRIIEKRAELIEIRKKVKPLDTQEGSKYDNPVAELAKLCDVPEFSFPRESQYPDPEKNKRKEGKSPYEKAVDNFKVQLDELIGKPGGGKREDVCDKKVKAIELETEKKIKERDTLRAPRSKTLEEFQSEALAARIELFRVVPRETGGDQATPRLIRVPTVVAR